MFRDSSREGDKPSQAASVLVVDGDGDFCELVSHYLTNSGYDVQTAPNEQAEINRLLIEPWQAIILGTVPPDLPGIEVLKRIRRASDVPVLIVSTCSEESDEIACLEAGADAYIRKDGPTRQLLAQLHAVVRRAANTAMTYSRFAPCERAVVVADLHIIPEAFRATLAGRSLELTRGEFTILLSLAKAKGNVKTRDHLYAEICGREYGIFDRTLDVHVCSLRKKLGDNPRNPRFIRTVRAAGYMLVDPDAS